MKFPRELVLQVREMLERGWDTATIASRMHVDPYLVQSVIDFINGVFT